MRRGTSPSLSTPFAVDVVQEQIEGSDTLLQSSFDARPFTRGDDARHQIGWDDALGRLIVAVDGEGDALMQERLLTSLLAQPELILRELNEPAMKLCVVGPHPAVGAEHLVVSAAEAVLVVDSVLSRLGLGAVSRLKRDHRTREGFMLHVRNEKGTSRLASSEILPRLSLAAKESGRRYWRSG
jgi:hypothetical protein